MFWFSAQGDAVHRRGFLRQISLAATLPLAAGSLGWSAVLARSAAAPAAGTGAPLQPVQLEFLTAFADALIPTTDTPGAVAAGVPEFLQLLYRDWFLPDEQASFTAGIEELARAAAPAHPTPFSRLAADERLALLRSWDAAAAEHAHDPPSERSFYSRLRGLVVIGYYTSEVGQKLELQMQYGAGADRPGGPVFGAVPFKI
jgi:gluconate 2-dehydrogenase gamma chain